MKSIPRFFKSDLTRWCVLAVVIRCAYCWWVIARFGLQQTSDFAYMFRLAGSLASGDGFVLGSDRIFNQSVGYPAFLALFFRAAGPSQGLVVGINIVLGVLAVAGTYVLTYYLVRSATPAGDAFDERIRPLASTAAGIATFYPDTLLYLPFASAENLLIPLTLALVWSVLAAWRSPWVGGAVTGALSAAVLSVKANAILLCPFICLVWAVGRRHLVTRTAAAVLVGTLCLLPWTYLNYRDSGGYIVPFAAIAGEVFLDGTNPLAKGRPTKVIDLPEGEKAGLNRIELDRAKLRKAIGYIKADPVWYAKLVVRKAVLSWSPVRDYMYENEGQYRFFGFIPSRWVPTLFNALLFVGLAGSMVNIRRLEPESRVLWCSLLAAPWMLQVVFVAYSRYRFPFLYCMIPYAAWGCWCIVASTGVVRPRNRRFGDLP